jgi:hypothetical protein
MSARTTLSVAASVIVGVAFVATVSTDALAKKARVRVAAAPPVVVLDYVGPPADRIPKCFNSAIFYPTPPCY